MKPNTIVDATIEGNLDTDAERIAMTIDPRATEHLISVLTDLYSDRAMAFIREYATNAHDAHVAAGLSRPIEISLPNALSPYYRVRDFGEGLSVEDMRAMYSKYGASTKRGSNDFNGMLGLGSKSALTYTAQFTIISVKDGIKHNVSVSRAANGVGEMEVVDSHPTTDEQGVEIVIPVKKSDVYSVTQKVNNFFQWWNEGTVLVNGKAPERFKGREVFKNVYMVDDLDRDYIVMGNVAYPLPDGRKFWPHNDYRHQFSVVYFAEMGEVTFAPPRESLQTTRNTMDTIERVTKEFAENFQIALQAEIDALPSKQQALIKAYDFRVKYREAKFKPFTYKGEVIPEGPFEAPFEMVKRPIPSYRATTWNSTSSTATTSNTIQQYKDVKEYLPFITYDAVGGGGVGENNELRLNDWANGRLGRVVFVVGAPKGGLKAYSKTKIRKGYEESLFPQGKFLLFITTDSKAPGDGWLDEVPVINWSVIRDFKVPSAGGSVRDREKHEVYDKNGDRSERIVEDENVVFVSPTVWRETDRWNRTPSKGAVAKWLGTRGYDGLVIINANRHVKFKRERPKAILLDEVLQTVARNYDAFLTPQEKFLLGLSASDLSALLAVKKSGVAIKDRTVVDFMSKASDTIHTRVHSDREKTQTMLYRLSGHGVRLPEIKKVAVFKDYPLVNSSHGTHSAHYINTIYKENNKKGN